MRAADFARRGALLSFTLAAVALSSHAAAAQDAPAGAAAQGGSPVSAANRESVFA